jgi:hypothetical protein
MFLQWPAFFAKLAEKFCQEIPALEESGGYRGHSTETLAKHTQLSSQSVVEAAIDRNRDVHIGVIKIKTFTRIE